MAWKCVVFKADEKMSQQVSLTVSESCCTVIVLWAIGQRVVIEPASGACFIQEFISPGCLRVHCSLTQSSCDRKRHLFCFSIH